MDYGKHFSTTKTPQNEQIPGTNQVENSAGGFAWQVDRWTQLDRFLILGSEGNTYYSSERDITKQNAAKVLECIKEDGCRVVSRLSEISDKGRAPKNDPALFVLAMCLKLGCPATRTAATEAVPIVVRIGTHLFHFIKFIKAFGGLGRNTKRAIANFYKPLSLNDTAYQMVKYQSRDGFSHADIIRLLHLKGDTPAEQALIKWSGAPYSKKPLSDAEKETLPRIIKGFERAKSASKAEIATIVSDYKLPRECVPTEYLNLPEVWEAMLPNMGLTAVIRNLATMTKIGFINPFSKCLKDIESKLTHENIKKSRVHPIQILSALCTYRSGRGNRSDATWKPVAKVVGMLDDAFYKAFDNVEPTGKNICIGLDVSSSMNGGEVGGVLGLTPRTAAAALCMITAAKESSHEILAFSHQLVQCVFPTKISLADVCNQLDSMPFGGTDCSLPIIAAYQSKWPIDAFIIYTDSETWAGKIHPKQALDMYRQKTGINAKLIVVGMVSNGFTIADPNDKGMLDIVGFDTAVPTLINDFIKE